MTAEKKAKRHEHELKWKTWLEERVPPFYEEYARAVVETFYGRKVNPFVAYIDFFLMEFRDDERTEHLQWLFEFWMGFLETTESMFEMDGTTIPHKDWPQFCRQVYQDACCHANLTSDLDFFVEMANAIKYRNEKIEKWTSRDTQIASLQADVLRSQDAYRTDFTHRQHVVAWSYDWLMQHSPSWVEINKLSGMKVTKKRIEKELERLGLPSSRRTTPTFLGQQE